MSEIDDLDRDLAATLDELLRLAPDGFLARYELLKRRDGLRAKAAAFRVDDSADVSSDDLLAAYRALRSSLDHAPGRNPLAPAETRTSEVAGLARDRTESSVLTARLQRIEEQLRRRGIDPDGRRRRTTR